MGEAGGFVGGDPFVGGLFQAEAGEEHFVRLGKLCGRAAAEIDLFEQQVGLCGRKCRAEAGGGRVERAGIFGKFGEKCASRVAR